MNIRELGYLLIGAPEVEEWRRFSIDVLGAMAADGPQGALYIKVDPRSFRFAVLPGHENGLLASGWLVAGAAALSSARTLLKSHDIRVEDGNQEGCQLRKVQAYFGFTDPAGHRHELAWGPISDYLPFSSPIGVSGFVTENLGLGHVVLTAPDNFEEEVSFWTDIADFGLSDILHLPIPDAPRMPRVHFLHCNNPRQHSLAFGELPIPGGCIHVMLEVKSIDDVGRCFDRVVAHNVAIAATIGRHVNDDMVSFYIKTPGGFALEYGVGGKTVDWLEHIPFETTRGSHWGHVWAAP